MSKNFFIILLAGLLIIALFKLGCGKNQPNNDHVIDSLGVAIMLKNDTIGELQLQLNNLDAAYGILKQQKQTIKYETKTIWQTKYITDSTINAYSDTTTIRKFIERFYSF